MRRPSAESIGTSNEYGPISRNLATGKMPPAAAAIIKYVMQSYRRWAVSDASKRL